MFGLMEDNITETTESDGFGTVQGKQYPDQKKKHLYHGAKITKLLFQMLTA